MTEGSRVVRRVRPHDEQPGAPGSAGGGNGPGGERRGAAGGVRVPAASRVAAITGAPSGVLIVAASASSRLLPWILVCPNVAPCLRRP